MGEHVDDTLGFWFRRRLRLLWICGTCRRYLASYRAAIRAAKSLGSGSRETPDEQLTEAVIQAIGKAANRS
jgi:hypothetical protein